MYQKKTDTYTSEEYLALEGKADYKSEFYRGEIFAMAGGSANHDRISGNFYATLNFALETNPCEVFSSDMKLEVDEGKLYTYPDVMVVCGEPQFVVERTDIITNPILIVEVLSKSTQDYDRGLKFELYQTIDTLQEYILIDQDRVRVELFRKLEDGRWMLTILATPEANLAIQSIDLELPLNRIYNKVDWFAA